MTDPTNPPVAGATSDSENQTPKETVSYETHRKLLDEKKKIQARLEQIETDRKASEEAELAKKGELQKLLDMRTKEAGELREKLQREETRKLQAKKLSAIVKGLGAPVEEKWYGVLGNHIDDVVYNQEADEIEQMSVTTVVENLKKTWPEMLKRPAAGMPNNAPRGNDAATIARDEWLKLPSKEMAKWGPGQIIETQ